MEVNQFYLNKVLRLVKKGVLAIEDVKEPYKSEVEIILAEKITK